MTSSFKFEVWPVRDFDGTISGYVVTRPIQDGEDDEGEPIVRNFSKVHSTAQIAFQEVRVAIDNMLKLYAKPEQKK